MKSLKDYIVSKDKISAMRRRVKDHISRVQHFYELMCITGLIPDNARNDSEIKKHDSDKFEPENLRRQALRFIADRTPEMDDEITAVVREHIRNNPHHFEYWGGPKCDQFSTNIDCSSMPDKYLYEMLADWASTAEEKGNTVGYFYDKHAGKKFKFSERQDKIIRECAEYLDKNIQPSMKRKYSEVYVDPSKIEH